MSKRSSRSAAVALLLLLTTFTACCAQDDPEDEPESVHHAEEIIAMFDENGDSLLEDHELEETLTAIAEGTTAAVDDGHGHRRRLQIAISEEDATVEHSDVTAESLLAKYGGDDGLMNPTELAESAMEIVECQLNENCHLGEEAAEDEEEATVGAKVGVILIILIESLVGGMIPICLKMRLSQSVLAHLNALTAGVFLATGLTHLLPHAVEGFAGVEVDDYPLAYVFTLLGYFMVLAAEETARTHSRPLDQDQPLSPACTSQNVDAVEMKDIEVQQQPKQFVDTLSLRHSSSAIIAAASLSVHSVFAGISLGLQETDHDLWKMMAVIAAHKGLAAFALGTKLLQAKFHTRRVIATIILFSLVTPIGTLIGFSLHEMSEATRAVFDALSAGVFIYLGSTGAEKDIGEEHHEIVDKTGEKRHKAMMRGLLATEYFSLIAGATLLCALNGVESGLGGHGDH